MTAPEFARELSLPLRSAPLLLTAALYLIVAGFVVAVFIVNPLIGGVLGLIVTVVMLPALMRYLLHVAEWRAASRDVEPPSAEMFELLGPLRPLSALLVLVAAAVFWQWLDARFGVAVAAVWLLLFASIYPAMIGMLAITNSVIEFVNPAALLRLIVNAGGDYWFAPVTALAALLLPALLAQQSRILAAVAFAPLLFAVFAVSGAVLSERRLIEEVGIPDPVEPDVDKQTADLRKQRTAVLNHAYGFFSRDNRRGALAHLDDWLARDPDANAARPWFFERMLDWETKDPALYFAQAYLSHLLAVGDDVRAVKLMLRCRLVSERFRPLPEDLERAVGAAEATGNSALATALADGGGL